MDTASQAESPTYRDGSRRPVDRDRLSAVDAIERKFALLHPNVAHPAALCNQSPP